MADENGVKVLVVDDNPATLYSTGRFLRAAGFVVREATTGQEALDLAKEGPNAIVLDVNLPDIDGFEVCKTLRARERTARTPIIHLSATFVGTDDKVQGLDAGADGYLTHPVEPPVLVATLNAFLRARTAEENMRRSEEKFRAIFDQAVNGIALLSNELIYLEVNPSMCRILGRERSEIIGASISSLAPLDHKERVGSISHELEPFGVWKGSFPLTRPDGGLVELDWHISFHSIPGMRLAEVTDITDRRVAEREREYLLASERVARTEAERANRLKDEFLAMVSHELRSPLNAIVGWARYLKTSTNTDIRDYTKAIDAIDRNATAQAQLIADLLDVSSITSGKMRLDLQPVEFADIVHNSLDGQIRAADEKSITVTPEFDSRSAVIQGDVGRLQQMMSNLLSNAIKFTPRGGRIWIRLQRQSSSVEIAISDTGQGIGKEFLPFIFDTFRQEDAVTTRIHEGLGLGLAIVKRIVEMHGGTIAAESDGKDRGSTFIVRLPLVNSAEEPRNLDSKSNADSLGGFRPGLRVMVVDDDADARYLICRILNDYGAIVAEASSASEAMALLKGFDPQILVSDIGMPGEDGYGLIKQVRANGYDGAQLPAVALTAFGRPEDRSRLLESGYQVHLRKPVEPNNLIKSIGQLMKDSESILRSAQDSA